MASCFLTIWAINVDMTGKWGWRLESRTGMGDGLSLGCPGGIHYSVWVDYWSTGGMAHQTRRICLCRLSRKGSAQFPNFRLDLRNYQRVSCLHPDWHSNSNRTRYLPGSNDNYRYDKSVERRILSLSSYNPLSKVEFNTHWSRDQWVRTQLNDILGLVV